ncbi:MAG: thioredoxin-dependent thiol peroxidase [Planctomycetota bacterium]
MAGIREGAPAPDFTLRDQEGKEVSLKDLRGKEVILYFYPKDDTPGCTKEACGFRDAWKELQKRGVEVLGVSPDSEASHRSFAAKYRLPFRLLSDPDRRVMKAYGAWGQKVMYGKTTEGVIRSTVWIGPEGTVKRHWKKVRDAGAHPAQVLEALRAPGTSGGSALTRTERRRRGS